MKYSIEDLLQLVADFQEFPHENDMLDVVVKPYSLDELKENELEYAAAARGPILSFQQFQHKYLKK